jgi:hypothetical protein
MLSSEEAAVAKTKVPAPAGKPGLQRKRVRKRRMGTGAVIGITNCVLVGVTAAYVATGSVLVTLIAAAAAVLLTGLALIHG